MKKGKSSSRKKKRYYSSDSDSDSKQGIGLSGTEDLVHVERVEKNMAKKTKLGIYTPSNPIKTTPEYDNSITSDKFSEQQKHSPSSKQDLGVTAVMAVMTA